MMQGFYSLIVAQDAANAARSAQAENGARWAVSSHTIETKGLTSARIADPVMFEAPFTQAPYISTGLAIRQDADPASGWIPQVSAGVWQWHRNTKGHYTGAYLFVHVGAGAIGSVLQHHFTFSGLAYKDLGQDVSTEAQLLAPRPVGFGGI
jgi:hypothetical protein